MCLTSMKYEAQTRYVVDHRTDRTFTRESGRGERTDYTYPPTPLLNLAICQAADLIVGELCLKK